MLQCWCQKNATNCCVCRLTADASYSKILSCSIHSITTRGLLHLQKTSAIFSPSCDLVSEFMEMYCPCLLFPPKWAPFHNNTSSSELENGPVASENVFYSRHCTSDWFIYTKKAVANFSWMFHAVSSVVCSLRTWQQYQLSYQCPCWQNKSVYESESGYETGLAHSSGMTRNKSLTLSKPVEANNYGWKLNYIK